MAKREATVWPGGHCDPTHTPGTRGWHGKVRERCDGPPGGRHAGDRLWKTKSVGTVLRRDSDKWTMKPARNRSNPSPVNSRPIRTEQGRSYRTSARHSKPRARPGRLHISPSHAQVYSRTTPAPPFPAGQPPPCRPRSEQPRLRQSSNWAHNLPSHVRERNCTIQPLPWPVSTPRAPAHEHRASQTPRAGSRHYRPRRPCAQMFPDGILSFRCHPPLQWTIVCLISRVTSQMTGRDH